MKIPKKQHAVATKGGVTTSEPNTSGWERPSIHVKKLAMEQFESQKLVDLDSEVPAAFNVTLHNRFNSLWFKVRAGECPRVQ